jgi:hypothetical protein
LAASSSVPVGQKVKQFGPTGTKLSSCSGTIGKEVAIQMIDMKIDSHHYTALDDEEFAEYQRLKQENNKEHLHGVWSLRQAYKYIGKDYKFMQCILRSNDGHELLKKVVIPSDKAHGHYDVFAEEFIDIWDKHKADLVLIARRMRPVLYPGK